MAALRKRGPRQAIADRLRKFRLRAGLSQEVAAQRLKITRGTWCIIEQGRQSIPAERLADFAAIVGANVGQLLGVE